MQWHSFLLRPRPGRERSLENFKQYTQGWRRPGAMESEAVFSVWSTEEGPPSHSIPPHLAAKAAWLVSEEAFEAMHERLFRAYFTENRDITHPDVLEELWLELNLPPLGLHKTRDPELVKEIFTQHEQAVQHGATGVPAYHMVGGVGAFMGAEPLETFRRWIRRTLDTRGGNPCTLG